MWRGISLREANLAYVAEDDPALALHEIRRRRAEAPQNVHTALGEETVIPDERALANLCEVAAEVRTLNAREGSQIYWLHPWLTRDPLGLTGRYVQHGLQHGNCIAHGDFAWIWQVLTLLTLQRSSRTGLCSLAGPLCQLSHLDLQGRTDLKFMTILTLLPNTGSWSWTNVHFTPRMQHPFDISINVVHSISIAKSLAVMYRFEQRRQLPQVAFC